MEMTDNDLFNPADDQSELFSQGDPTPDKDFVAELVGDGKKFKDVNALARGKAASDAHIARLEREMSELRQELTQRLTLEEFYEKVKTTAPPSPSNPPAPPGDDRSGNEISLEQVGSLVDQRLKEANEVQRRKSNLDFVVSELQKRLGSNFQALMRERAQQLGESENDLNLLAQTRPKVFLELMAPGKKVEQSFSTPPRPTMDSGKLPHDPKAGVRNQAYYNELKKKDPKLYWDRRTQSQMHKDAQALGADYFQ